MGRFEEALAAYLEAADSWKYISDLLFEEGIEDNGRDFLVRV
jgi:hypothetical protein